MNIGKEVQEEHIKKVIKDSHVFFTGFSGAGMWTTTGNDILSIAYNPKYYDNEHYAGGLIIFSKIVDHLGYFNILITYPNEHNKLKSILIKDVFLYDPDTEEMIGPNDQIEYDKCYTFKHSEVVEGNNHEFI